ncbi:MAG TPA: hypothetical protein VM409_07910 [Chloroflexia bacterium]|nr:hypothetical protein [Chloroflexia bacterium]
MNGEDRPIESRSDSSEDVSGYGLNILIPTPIPGPEYDPPRVPPGAEDPSREDPPNPPIPPRVPPGVEEKTKPVNF